MEQNKCTTKEEVQCTQPNATGIYTSEIWVKLHIQMDKIHRNTHTGHTTLSNNIISNLVQHPDYNESALV